MQMKREEGMMTMMWYGERERVREYINTIFAVCWADLKGSGRIWRWRWRRRCRSRWIFCREEVSRQLWKEAENKQTSRVCLQRKGDRNVNISNFLFISHLHTYILFSSYSYYLHILFFFSLFIQWKTQNKKQNPKLSISHFYLFMFLLFCSRGNEGE